MNLYTFLYMRKTIVKKLIKKIGLIRGSKSAAKMLHSLKFELYPDLHKL